MNREKIKDIVLYSSAIILVGLLLLFVVRKLLPVFSPFIIAWAVAFAVRGPARKLSKRTKVPEAFYRVFIAVFATLLTFAAVAIILWQSGAALWRFLSGIDENSPVFLFLKELGGGELPLFGNIIPEELLSRLSEAINGLITSLMTRLGEALTSWVSFIPSALFYTLVTIISLIYFSLDLERINRTVKSLLPTSVSDWLTRFRKEAFAVILKYIRSYLFILLITFAVMLSGFLILRVRNSALVALVVALLDILPVIGVGTVLVPWSIFAFLSGNIGRGVGLLVLFLVNTVIRQFSEPKIVGKSLDLHPVLTLVSLYVGYALFGLLGLILAPLIAVTLGLLKNNSTSEVA